MNRLFAVLGAVVIAAQAQADTTNVYAAWSQVIGHTAPQAMAPPTVEMRFVTDTPQDCATFLVADPGKTPTEVTQSGTQPMARPQVFTDIGVCRLPIPGVQAQLYDSAGQPVTLTSKINRHNHSLAAHNWTPGPSDGAEIVVAGTKWIGRNADFQLLTLGDTGCRGGSEQNCNKWQLMGDWPFPEISIVGAQTRPDLVIHVGDYRYFREHHIKTDTWQLWQKDFFPAAQPLLMAAPWAFARGNHEGCPNAGLRYGVGYFQFFAQNDQISCDNLGIAELSESGPAEEPMYRSPWYFDVMPNGGAAKDAHRFVIIDANNYGGSVGISWDQANAHFETAIKITKAGAHSSWWVWHSPAVQRINWSGGTYGDNVLRAALLAAAQADTPQGNPFCPAAQAPNCNPSMFLLGHQHFYQDVTFTDGKIVDVRVNNTDVPHYVPGPNWVFPQSTIVGHGGVNLRKLNPSVSGSEYCFDKDFPIGANGTAGVVNSVVDHGFVLWTRKANAQTHGQAGWSPLYAWATDFSVNGWDVTGRLGGMPHTPPAAGPLSCTGSVGGN